MKDPFAAISQITHPDEGPCPLCSYIFDTHKDGCPYEAIDAALAVSPTAPLAEEALRAKLFAVGEERKQEWIRAENAEAKLADAEAANEALRIRDVMLTREDAAITKERNDALGALDNAVHEGMEWMERAKKAETKLAAPREQGGWISVKDLEVLAESWMDWAREAPVGYGLVAARTRDKFVPELRALVLSSPPKEDK